MSYTSNHWWRLDKHKSHILTMNQCWLVTQLKPVSHRCSCCGIALLLLLHCSAMLLLLHCPAMLLLLLHCPVAAVASLSQPSSHCPTIVLPWHSCCVHIGWSFYWQDVLMPTPRLFGWLLVGLSKLLTLATINPLCFLYYQVPVPDTALQSSVSGTIYLLHGRSMGVLQQPHLSRG